MSLDPIVVAKIVTLLEDGSWQRETGRIVGFNLYTVQRVYQRFLDTDLNVRRPAESGRNRVTIQ